MNFHDLSPLTIAKYSEDFLIELVRNFTRWNQRSEVSAKEQLKYLFGYLNEKHVKANTLVVENEYIDKHFLEDYSQYYSRCFTSYSKKCVRIHFFKNEFKEYDFLEYLRTNDQSAILQLKSSYLGYAVIRPIPHTFIAKLCILPYDYISTNPEYKVITSDISSRLFGIEFDIKTSPFIEQDRVVSECATSAIWTLLSSGLLRTPPETLPSLSAITQIASSTSNDGSKTFPNGGLTYKQVAGALKYYGLEPSIIEINNENELKELVYAYVSSDIPMLIGGEIFKSDSSDSKTPRYKNLGRHFSCILGYHLDTKSSADFKSQEIDKIYAHDDRLGPFVRIKTKSVTIEANDQNSKKSKVAYEISIKNDKPQFISPEMVIIGLYHKIRIPFNVVKDFIIALGAYLSIESDNLNLELAELNSKVVSLNKEAEKKDTNKSGDPKSKHDYYKELKENISRVTNSQWEIKLTTNSKLKSDLIETEDFYTFNGSSDKSSVLIHSMPKYIWQFRIIENRRVLTEILIDATEVPQGNLIIGLICYDEKTDEVWRHVESRIASRVWQQFKFPQDKSYQESIRPLFKFYTNIATNQTLNALYGYLALPRRGFKNGETDKDNNIVTRTDVYSLRSNNIKWDFLSTLIKYIWVIDESGSLIIGEDVRVKDADNYDYFYGHPTLMDGKPARLGGELYYNSLESIWLANLASGTYSSHIKEETEAANYYLNNVIENNFTGLSVRQENKNDRLEV